MPRAEKWRQRISVWSGEALRTSAWMGWAGGGGNCAVAPESGWVHSGMENAKVLPTLGSDSTQISPCIISTSWRQMHRPRPVPPWRRVVEASTCRKGWKSWPRNSGAIPTPVSRTKQMICTRRCSGQVSEGSGSAWPCLSVTQICPPGPVNFTALVTRFMMICWRRPASPISAICMFGSMSTTSSMPPAWALCRATVQTWCTTSSSMNGACSSSRCPASIFDTSSRSLMISRSAREDWRMARR